MDLIGFDKKCLVRPRRLAKEKREFEGEHHGGNGKPERTDNFHAGGRQKQSSDKHWNTSGKPVRNKKNNDIRSDKAPSFRYKTNGGTGKTSGTDRSDHGRTVRQMPGNSNFTKGKSSSGKKNIKQR
jgi:hypothetical protein